MRIALIALLTLSGCQRALCWIDGGHVLEQYEPASFGGLVPYQTCIVDVRHSWRLK